ncbi:MAG: FmdE family protein [Anaerolineae bacterium]|nr:MAG: FmdE family protein [Anaerolineae bacterium]
MKQLARFLEQSASMHRHLCPRQVLGVRMGMLAGDILNLDLPQSDKRLLTFVETDGCTADGISVATGCWLGRRTMRLFDFGKVAATFVDTKTNAAVRIWPHPRCREIAYRYAPKASSRWVSQLEAYQIMPMNELLVAQEVTLSISHQDIVSRPGVRARCDICHEEIINQRETVRDELVLCRACAGAAYYTYQESNLSASEDRRSAGMHATHQGERGSTHA